MTKSNPMFGERTRYYPAGYGFCHCGCRQATRPSENGIYPLYLANHFRSPRTFIESINPKQALGKPVASPRRFTSESQQAASRTLDTKSEPLPQRYVGPDQGLLDEYQELALKYGELRRHMEFLSLEIEQSVRLLDDLWVDGEESKGLVLKKLQGMFASLESIKKNVL